MKRTFGYALLSMKYLMYARHMSFVSVAIWQQEITQDICVAYLPLSCRTFITYAKHVLTQTHYPDSLPNLTCHLTLMKPSRMKCTSIFTLARVWELLVRKYYISELTSKLRFSSIVILRVTNSVRIWVSDLECDKKKKKVAELSEKDCWAVTKWKAHKTVIKAKFKIICGFLLWSNAFWKYLGRNFFFLEKNSPTMSHVIFKTRKCSQVQKVN